VKTRPAAALEPAILHGQVVHRRLRPRTHAFAYPAFVLRLPLSRLDALPASGLPIGRRGRVSFDPADHGDGSAMPLREFVATLLATQGVVADGEVVLYAFPRMLGQAFKPVSFFACHGVDGTLRAIVAEVNNTFGERHHYVLHAPGGAPLWDGVTLVAGKTLHVSPFCAVRGHYRFRFRFAAGRWLARIDYHDDDGASPLIETWISGRAAALDREALRGLVWRYGWFTVAVLVRIHLQAVRLWAKRVPSFRKPQAPGARATAGTVSTSAWSS
jgi:DUF1365 family protein